MIRLKSTYKFRRFSVPDGFAKILSVHEDLSGNCRATIDVGIFADAEALAMREVLEVVQVQLSGADFFAATDKTPPIGLTPTALPMAKPGDVMSRRYELIKLRVPDFAETEEA